MLDYNVLRYNIVDSQGEFSYKIKLSDRIWFDEDTGYLYCNDAVLGNVGVQLYKGRELGFADGNSIVKVHRMAQDIFDEKSLDSLKGIPVTLEHPKEKVKSKNVQKYIKGAVYGTPKHDGENIICDIVIYDQDLIDLVAPKNDDGERVISDEFRDLSLGYSAKLIPLEDSLGEYKQEDIKYNHLAVVKQGRAQNAMIRDTNEEFEKGAKPKLGLFARLKGKKVTQNEETKEVVVSDEALEIEVDLEDVKRVMSEEMRHSIYKRESYDDPNKQIVTEVIEKTVTTEEDKEKTLLDSEKEKEQTMEIVKDKAYFQKQFADAQALPDGEYKEDVIKELNDEYRTVFPKQEPKKVEVKDSVAKDLKPENKVFKDEKTKEVDFEYLENESKIYYNKLSNPFAHQSYEDYKKFYDGEVQKGKNALNVQ